MAIAQLQETVLDPMDLDDDEFILRRLTTKLRKWLDERAMRPWQSKSRTTRQTTIGAFGG